jgi:hypothetical protein
MALPFMIIPLVGLAVDATMLYIVQAKLAVAVDGAALGAGRLLGTLANPTEIAGEFLKANFPDHYWGAYNLQPDISITTSLSTHTISVAATVDVPLLFMRILKQDHSTVAASAVATRRDSRVMLVLDRSYSMRNNIADLRTAATTFTNMFTAGTDQLGLVVFGGSAMVAYPTTIHLSATGPNTHYADPPGGGGDNMLTMINAMEVGSDTGTSEGLWLAYQELKKAYSLDLDPSRLNAIVLFTDGVPNGFTAFFNDPSSGGANNALASASNCTYNPALPADPTTNMYGFMCTRGSGSGMAYFTPIGTSSKGYGTFKMLQFDATNTAKYWMNHLTTQGGATYVNDELQISGRPYTNCTNLSGTSLTGLKKIPPSDYYGTSTTGAANPYSLLYQTYNVAYDSTKPTSGYHVGLASWNAVDNTAKRILADATMNVSIYCIGYTGNGGLDASLMKRVGNTLDSTSHNTAWQTGLYVEAADSAGMTAAFYTVASEILRLAK